MRTLPRAAKAATTNHKPTPTARHRWRAALAALTAAIALTPLAFAPPASAMYDTVQGLSADGCPSGCGDDNGQVGLSAFFPTSTDPYTGNASNFDAFRADEPLRYYRLWVPYNYFAYSNDGSTCQYTSHATGSYWGENDPLIQFFKTLYDDKTLYGQGIVPIVQFDEQPQPGTPQLDGLPPSGDVSWAQETVSQRCEVKWLSNSLGNLGYLDSGADSIMYEGINEPDNTWSPQHAADWTINNEWGGYASSFSSRVGYLAGTWFSQEFSKFTDYVTELNAYSCNGGPCFDSIGAWDYHDYADPNSSETLNGFNGCSDGNGYANCDHSYIDAFENWDYSNGDALPIWITETAGALKPAANSSCAPPPPTEGLCGNHNALYDAYAATDMEYIPHYHTNIPVVLWDHYWGPGGTEDGWWDAGLLVPSYLASGSTATPDCERASWDVLAEHDSTGTAATDAVNRSCNG